MLELTTNIRTTGPLQLSLAVAGTKRPHCMAEFNPSLDMVQLEAKDPYRVQKIECIYLGILNLFKSFF